MKVISSSFRLLLWLVEEGGGIELHARGHTPLSRRVQLHSYVTFQSGLLGAGTQQPQESGFPYVMSQRSQCSYHMGMSMSSKSLGDLLSRCFEILLMFRCAFFR